jgi:hypothetical protein
MYDSVEFRGAEGWDLTWQNHLTLLKGKTDIYG